MTIGMSVTVSEIEVPSSAVRPTGSTRASPSASRSRKSCVSSLRAWAMMRRMVPTPSGGERALLGNGEKDVLERVVLLDCLEDADAVAGEPFLEPAQGGRVLEIRADNPLRAVAVLKQEMEPWRVSLFGDRFHVIVDGDAQAAGRWLEERLARDGIRVLEAIEQDYSLEDVFLAIAEKGALAA